MRGVNVIIKKELKEELKNLSKQVVIGAANYTRDTLTDAAYEAFERFYCDYSPAPYGLGTNYRWKFYTPVGTPYYYDRTYNVLRNGIHKFESKGTIKRGGVELNPDWLEEVYDDASPALVFYEIYEGGRHGYFGDIPSMTPAPEELIDSAYYDIIDNVDNLIMGEATKFVRGCTYLRPYGITRKAMKLKGSRRNK